MLQEFAQSSKRSSGRLNTDPVLPQTRCVLVSESREAIQNVIPPPPPGPNKSSDQGYNREPLCSWGPEQKT